MGQRAPFFELRGAQGGDPLELWSLVPDGGGDEPSLLPGSPALQPVITFAVGLPAGTAEAASALAARARRLRLSAAALETVPPRLEALYATPPAASPTASGFPSASPEVALLQAVDALRQAQAEPARGEFVDPAGAAGQARLRDFVASINREILSFAWVQTEQEGRVIARTAVDWGADVRTLLSSLLRPEQADLHIRTLRYVAASRALTLRLCFTVASGAARLAVLAALPGAAPYLMVAVYEFALKVIEQAVRLSEVEALAV